MATRTFNATKDNSSRVQNDGDKQGCGKDNHIIVGRSENKVNLYRSYIQFGLNFDGMAKITKAELVLYTSSAHDGNGSYNDLRTRLLTESWSEGDNAAESFGHSDYIRPSHNPNYHISGNPPSSDSAVEFRLNITKHVLKWAPTKVQGGGAQKNYGIALHSPDETRSDRSVFYSRHYVTTSQRPVIVVTYDPVPVAPSVTLVGPSGAIPDLDANFVGNFVSNTLPATDVPSRVFIELFKVGEVTATWTKDRVTSGSEQAAKQFSEPLPASLKSGINYEWRATIWDQLSLKSAPSAKMAFNLANTPPVASVLAPAGTLQSLDGAAFTAKFTDSDPGDQLAALQLQLQPDLGGTASWADPATRLWDTDVLTAHASETQLATISREYGGRTIPAGTYDWRVRLQDNRGGWSAWVEQTFTLATAYTPDLQDPLWTTGYLRERPPVRILIMDLNKNPTTGVVINRGPGKTLAIIEDASNIGASEYLNAPGEFFFTLPATHPQVSVVEPYITHYRLEQYRHDRWVPIYKGLITDFEASEDETVFYGMDYMGLLNLSVDERYDPDGADVAEPAGSKYNDKTIKYIIDTQLNLAKAEANGLVNFIDKAAGHSFPAPAPTTASITIFSTFKQRLDFIVGLIQSQVAGTGKVTRLFPRLDTDGVHRWYLFDDYGQRRNNIRMEYGGLVQGFTVIALGEFGTTFYGIGRIFQQSGLKFSKTGAPGLVESSWGHIAKVTSFNDLVDLNDLNRRTREFASKTGTVGKRIAIGIRVDGLNPYDGFDVGDRVPVLIQHGNVDTTRYGSMYWTIVGTEYEVAPDGHTTLTLVLLPEANRGDLVIPPDLIPSVPIVPPTGGGGGNPEWEVGYIPPDGTTGDFYLDLTTGIIWEQTGTGWVISTSPPVIAAPVAVSLASTSDTNEQGGTVAKLTATITPDPTWGTEYRGTYVEVTTETDDSTPPNPVWDNAQLIFIPAPEVEAAIEGVVTSVPYYAQGWAVDFVGNVSTVMAGTPQDAASDTEPPGQPQGFTVVPQVAGFFAGWDPSSARDLAFAELRFAEDDGTGTGVGASPGWVIARARTNFAFVGGLTPGTKYWAQVRAVDTSDNVEDASVTPPVTYKSTNFPDIGFTALVEVTPVKVDSELIEPGAIDPDHIGITGIPADAIKTGLLKVSLSDSTLMDGIQVMSGGVIVGLWNETGLYVYQASDPGNYVRLYDAGLTVFRAGIATTAITPDGINATAIVLGALPGGNNIIPNSSFELVNFATAVTVDTVWTASADWTATRVGTDVNVTTAATQLNEGAATY